LKHSLDEWRASFALTHRTARGTSTITPDLSL
jgi:hypothetical protein